MPDESMWQAIKAFTDGKTNRQIARAAQFLSGHLVGRLEEGVGGLRPQDDVEQDVARDLARLALEVERDLLQLSERARNVRWMVEENDPEFGRGGNA